MFRTGFALVKHILVCSLILNACFAGASPKKTQENCEPALVEKTEFPEIKPLALKTLAEPFDDPGWLFEMKYDGFRGLVYIDQKRCRVISRQNKELSQFQKLCDTIARQLKVKNAVLDGEVIAYDETHRPVFSNLLRRLEPYQYVAFDILFVDGQDLRNLPLWQRRKILHKILPRKSDFVVEALSIVGSGKKLYQLMIDHDLEGIVAKRLSDKYGRSTKWYKIKNKSYSQVLGRSHFFKRPTTRGR